MNAPSLNTGSVKRLVVAIGTTGRSCQAPCWKFCDDAIAFGRRRVDRHQVVVMQVDALRAERRKPVHGLHRVQRGRTNSPKGSRPRLPTVQSPNVNLSAGVGVRLIPKSSLENGRRHGPGCRSAREPHAEPETAAVRLCARPANRLVVPLEGGSFEESHRWI